jgi:hypothetical protein
VRGWEESVHTDYVTVISFEFTDRVWRAWSILKNIAALLGEERAL